MQSIQQVDTKMLLIYLQSVMGQGMRVFDIP